MKWVEPPGRKRGGRSILGLYKQDMPFHNAHNIWHFACCELNQNRSHSTGTMFTIIEIQCEDI